MAGGINWVVLLSGLAVVFVFWSWVPLERLDRYWKWNNPVGRPLLHTIVLIGVPAFYAKLTATPWPGLLIPISFLLTQYAVLSGRFQRLEMFIAGWVLVLTSALIWIWFFLWAR